jgi:murein L,D-transpeptidase YafK
MHRAILGFLVAVLLAFTACQRNKAKISAEQADRVLILKSAHTLRLMKRDRTLRTYKVALGRNPIGPKNRKGDHRTPEGHYIIDAKKEHSRFYRARHISYPGADDRKRALKEGYDPGGDVGIHGIESGLGWIGPLHRSIE